VKRWPAASAVLSFLIPFVIYFRSLSTWAQASDTGEMQTVPYILGIPHPTGFPLFVLLGWVFSHIVAVSTVAWRMNLLSALEMAGAAAVIRLLALSLGAAELPALGASLVFAVTNVAWTKGSHTDVHALSLLLSLLTFLAIVRFAQTDRQSALIWGALAFGLGLATHPVVLWCGLPLLAAVVVVARRNLKEAALLLGVAAAPLLLYAYLPIRSAIVAAQGLDPAGKPPFDGHGAAFWDYNHPRTLSGFLAEVSGSQFRAPAMLGSIFNVPQYPRYALAWWHDASAQLLFVTIVLALFGIAAVARTPGRLRLGGLAILVGAVAAVPFAYAYTAEADFTRYLFPSLAITAVFSALGSQLVAVNARRTATTWLGLGLLGIAFLLYQANSANFAARDDRGGQAMVDQIRAILPDNAVVVCDWLDGTEFAYAAYVERSLGRRLVILYSSHDVEYYLKWAKQYPVFVYANFAIVSAVPQDVPPECLHETRLPDAMDHKLFRIACATVGRSRYGGRVAATSRRTKSLERSHVPLRT
jgi:hypothetical protein